MTKATANIINTITAIIALTFHVLQTYVYYTITIPKRNVFLQLYFAQFKKPMFFALAF